MSLISIVIMLPCPKTRFSTSLTFHYEVFIYPASPLHISLNTYTESHRPSIFFFTLHVQNRNLSKSSFSESRSHSAIHLNSEYHEYWEPMAFSQSLICGCSLGLEFSIFRPDQKPNMAEFILGVKKEIRTFRVFRNKR